MICLYSTTWSVSSFSLPACFPLNITMTSRWANWRLKSLPSSGLFVQASVRVVSSKKISILRVTGLCEENPPVTGGLGLYSVGLLSEKCFHFTTSSWNTMKFPYISTLSLWCYPMWSLEYRCFVHLIHSLSCLATSKKRTYLPYNTLLLLRRKTVLIGAFYARMVLPTVWLPALREMHYIIILNEWLVCPFF